MTSAPDEIDGRSIHYKHCDANFYQTFAFVFGRLISTIPQVCTKEYRWLIVKTKCLLTMVVATFIAYN